MKVIINYKDGSKETKVGLKSLKNYKNRDMVLLHYSDEEEDVSGVLEIPSSAIESIVIEDFEK